MQKFMSMSKDDLVVNSLSTSFDKLREWPYCVGTPEAIKDQSFLPRHARLALALAGGHPNPLIEINPKHARLAAALACEHLTNH